MRFDCDKEQEAIMWRLLALPAGLAIGLACALPAMAALQEWDCTYPGWPDQKPVIVKFFDNGGTLREDVFEFQGQPVVRNFTVLKNNDLSIVAADAISEMEPSHTTPSIGAELVVIGKQDGSYLETNSYLADPHNGFVQGQCISNN
jgi:hypothetical protein